MRNIIQRCVVIGISLLMVGCLSEPKPIVEAPAKFSSHGLAFSYPSNWTVTDDAPTDAVRVVLIESTGGVLVTLWLEPSDDATDLPTYARNFTTEWAKLTPFVTKTTPPKFGKVKTVVPYDEMLVTTTLTFGYVLNMPYSLHFSRRIIEDAAITAHILVATEDEQLVRPGYDLITSTLSYSPTPN